MHRLAHRYRISIGLALGIASGLLVTSADAQLPTLQGVQPIFNNQLGAWSATQPSAAGGPTSSHIPQRHYTIRVPRAPWWWGSPYAYGAPFYPPYPYYSAYGRPYYEPYYQQQVPPVIVVQPQIIVPPAVGSPNASTPHAVSRPPTVPSPAAPAPGGPNDPQEIANRVARLKPSSGAGRMRADQLLADGDREFAGKNYRRAVAKYREAIQRAPDYAVSYFRAGHAAVAMGDYDLAVTYFCMALELARSTNRGGFNLDELYRGDDAAKAEHLRALDVAAARQPLAGGLPFLTGITQHYDGHSLPAREQFRRAAELPGRHQPYTAYFLP